MANGNQIVRAATLNLIAQLNILNKVTNGLTDTVISTTITSSGTVAKLISAIDGLNLRNSDKFRRLGLTAEINRCKRYGTITDAMVETARAAGSGNFANLRDAIAAAAPGGTVSDAKLNAHTVWAQ